VKAILLLALLVVSTSAFAFNLSTDLKGIATVNVMVADLPDELIKSGVEKAALGTTLEDALKGAGLAVLEQGHYADTVQTITLHVSVVREPNGRFFATDTVLACFDNVSNRRAAGEFSALVWSKDVLQLLGMVDTRRVLEAEKKLIDLFLSDYQRANPK